MNPRYNQSIRFYWLIIANLIFISIIMNAQDTARFIGLGHLPNGDFSRANDISANGLVVVGYDKGYSFQWTETGGLVALPMYLNSINSVAQAVSGDGSVIVGQASLPGTPNNINKAVSWAGGTVSPLTPISNSVPASEISAQDICSDGTKIVGVYKHDFNEPNDPFEAVMWNSSGVKLLGKLPGANHSFAYAISADGNVIVGYCKYPIFSEAFRSVGGGSLQSLGTGGYFSSIAHGTSYDGEVIVGSISTISDGPSIAARWTSKGGWDLLQGTTVNSNAFDVSASGDIIVGQMSGIAFIWDRNNGARDLKFVLENVYDLDLTGWTLDIAHSIDSSGTVIVGQGTHNGMTEAWYAKLPQLKITKPTKNIKWIAGENDTIKWGGGKMNQFLQIDYSADSGKTFNIIDFIANGDTGIYVWDVPKNILSKKCMIRIVDMADTTITDTSEVFKIKPYILTRDSSGQYEPYRPSEDQWGFWNLEAHMFPLTWYQQFNYQGVDPFTGSQYSQWQGGYVFDSANSSNFPDWVSWVNAFGVNACYFTIAGIVTDIYKFAALQKWEAVKKPWKGSCFGIAASNALAFAYKGQFQTRYNSIFPPFVNPKTVLSNDGVKKVVNELFTHQFGNPSQQSQIGRWNVLTPNQTLNEIKTMLKEDNVSPRTLSIWNNNGAGGHNILPYKLEQEVVMKHKYNLYVYDNSYPFSIPAIIKIDTLGNSLNGTWTTLYGWANWGGPKYLMLENESNVYLKNASLPKHAEGYTSPFVLSSNELEIYTNINANTRIIDALGNVTGFSNGSILVEIPNSVPLTYLDGSETPPYGYSLPTENYSVIVDNFTSDTVKTFFFTGNKSFTYKTFDAEQNQTDRLFFDGGLSFTNPDPQSKTISLLNIMNETTQEKLFSFSSIELAQNDSVKVENPDSNKIKLTSFGSAKDYDIELNFVNENGIGRFGEFNIPLTSNSSHTITPNWNNVTNTDLKILVDEGNDGTVDDTLSLTNKITGIENEQGSILPTEFKLEQNYPNPFNPITTISYQIPINKHVTIKVYDVLGKEVATLIDEFKPAGIHRVEFCTSNFSSGVYFYKLIAGKYIDVKKMVLLK